MTTVALEDVQLGIEIPNSNLKVYFAYYAARIGETLAHHGDCVYLLPLFRFPVYANGNLTPGKRHFKHRNVFREYFVVAGAPHPIMFFIYHHISLFFSLYHNLL